LTFIPIPLSSSSNSNLTPEDEVVTAHPPDLHKEIGTTPYTYANNMGTPIPTATADKMGDIITEVTTPVVIIRFFLYLLMVFLAYRACNFRPTQTGKPVFDKVK